MRAVRLRSSVGTVDGATRTGESTREGAVHAWLPRKGNTVTEAIEPEPSADPRQPSGGSDPRRPRPKRSRLATFFMVAGITASVIAGLFVVAGILFIYSFSNSWGNK